MTSASPQLPELRIQTRPATLADTPVAWLIKRASHQDAVERQFGAWDDELQEKLFTQEWNPRQSQMITCDGTVCGWWSLVDQDDAVSIAFIGLLPRYCGQGTGSRLVRKAQEHAAQRGVPLRLTVLKQNRAAELYRRLGFAQTGQSETHLSMTWELSQPDADHLADVPCRQHDG